MKTINKTIIMILAALVFCMANTYADWFGLGSITKDDNLPENYMFNDFEGRGIQPEIGEDPIPKKYTGKGILPSEDGFNVTGIAPNNGFNQLRWKKSSNAGKWKQGIMPKVGKTGKGLNLPTGTGTSVIPSFSQILHAGVQEKNIIRPYQITAEDQKLLDMPLIIGVKSFGNILYNLRNTVLALCYLCCAINIVFQCFRLWFGVQELKKVYVDIIWKSICCVTLLAIYPAIVDGILTLSTGMGMHIGGGYKDFDETLQKAYAQISLECGEGVSAVEDMLKNMSIVDEEGNRHISEADYKKLCKYASDEALKPIKEKLNITLLDIDKATNINVYTWIDKDGKSHNYQDSNRGTAGIDNGPSWSEQLTAKRIQAEKMTGFDKIDKSALKKGATKLYAIAEVMDDMPLVEKIFDENGNVVAGYGNARNEEVNGRRANGEIVIVDSKGNAKMSFYAPFIKNSNKVKVTLIAMSSIVRTIQKFNDIIVLANNYDENEIAGIKGKKDDGTFGKKQVEYNPNQKWYWNGVSKLITSLVVKFGMFLCVLYIMAEYVITVIEFYIVTSLGVLLIPLMFIDSTKEYTKNLLRLFLQFFFKIMIEVMILFFVLCMYLQVSIVSLTELNLEASDDLATYVGTLILGLLLAGSVSKIASALLSGQPSMSMGDLAHQAHHVMAAGKMVGGAVRGVGHAIGGRRGADGKLHGGLLGAGRAGFRAASHHNQNTAAKAAGGAAAKKTAMDNFGTAGAGYTSKAGGIGGDSKSTFYSNKELAAMKDGTADPKFGSAEQQKEKYAALQKEAGDRADKGFQHQASSQWWRNAAYKFATNGEEKIMEGQKQRFTGVGSRTIDQNDKETTGNLMNQMENMNAAGQFYGGGDPEKGIPGNPLSFFQPPPSASSLDANMASSKPGAGDRADNGTDINYRM